MGERAISPPPGAPVDRAPRRHKLGFLAWWSKLLIPAFCLLGLVIVVGNTFLQAQGTPAHKPVAIFKKATSGSYALPTATATTAPTATATPLPPTPTPPPQRTPPPTSPPATGGGNVVNIIQSVFGGYANQALTVARCESSLNSAAVNPISIGGSHAEGLFQILYPSTWNTTPQQALSPFDAQANAQAAFAIFQRDGYSWREWACQPG